MLMINLKPYRKRWLQATIFSYYHLFFCNKYFPGNSSALDFLLLLFHKDYSLSRENTLYFQSCLSKQLIHDIGPPVILFTYIPLYDLKGNYLFTTVFSGTTKGYLGCSLLIVLLVGILKNLKVGCI